MYSQFQRVARTDDEADSSPRVGNAKSLSRRDEVEDEVEDEAEEEEEVAVFLKDLTGLARSGQSCAIKRSPLGNKVFAIVIKDSPSFEKPALPYLLPGTSDILRPPLGQGYFS